MTQRVLLAVLIACAACRPAAVPASVSRTSTTIEIRSIAYQATLPADWTVEKAENFELVASSTGAAMSVTFREFPIKTEGRGLHPEKQIAGLLAKKFSITAAQVPCAATSPDAGHCAMSFAIGEKRGHVHAKGAYVDRRFYCAMVMIFDVPGRDASETAAALLSTVRVYGEDKEPARI